MNSEKKEPLIKPNSKVLIFYEFHECRNFINAKYNIDIMDYYHYHDNIELPSAKYCNFMHWLHENYLDDAFVVFDYETLEILQKNKKNAWLSHIYELFLKEFGDNSVFRID